MLLAFTSPTSPETEDTYNTWYDEKHLHDVAGIEGVVHASRYRLVHGVELLPGVSGPDQGYLAIYELNAETEEELRAFAARLREALETGVADIDVSLNIQNLGAALAMPVGTPLVGVSA